MSTYSNAMLLHNPGVYLRCGESAGAVAVDASPNGRNGNNTNITLEAPSLLTDDTVNTAYGFGGASSKVEVPYGAWMNSNIITIITWIKTASNSLMSLLDRDGGSGNRPWQFRLNGGVLNYLQIGGSFQNLSGGASVADNVRHMVGVTVDATTITLYRDGAVANSGPSGGGPMSDTNVNLAVGVNRSPGEGAWFNGTQDEIAYIPGVALTPAQMANLWTIGSNPPVSTGSVVDRLRQEMGMVAGQSTSDVMQAHWRGASGLPVGRSMDDYVKGAGRKWFLDT